MNWILALWLGHDAVGCVRSALDGVRPLEQFATAATLLVLLASVLTRPNASTSSHANATLLVVAVSVFLPSVYERLTTHHPSNAADVARVLGLIGFAASGCALNRNFSVLPAVRGISERGPYALVRHPMYASYLVVDASFWLIDPTFRVFLLWCTEVIVFGLRIVLEERTLNTSERYVRYARRVRYRLLPLVF